MRKREYGTKDFEKGAGRARRAALMFIVTIGVVSLFSDMTHEGGKSILGAYLSLAGAPAAAIGFIAGLGKLIGYSLRWVTGRLADRTKKYWPLTIAGYALDLLAVPALALIPGNGWIWAATLIVAERTGKAIKKPAKDTLLSFAAAQNGVGRSFALQEFLDQLGAFAGPLVIFIVMYFRGSGDSFADYRRCFALLIVPAAVTLTLLYAGAMAVDAAAALFFGWLYDRCGLRSLVWPTLLSAPLAALVFSLRRRDSISARLCGASAWERRNRCSRPPSRRWSQRKAEALATANFRRYSESTCSSEAGSWAGYIAVRYR